VSDFKEPEMTINGTKLTPAQAMTLRVALGSFYMSLDVDGLGEDEHGRVMAAAYKAHAAVIYKLMQPPE
jgi:hypothetical protein